MFEIHDANMLSLKKNIYIYIYIYISFGSTISYSIEPYPQI